VDVHHSLEMSTSRACLPVDNVIFFHCHVLINSVRAIQRRTASLAHVLWLDVDFDEAMLII